jgi:beta-galactosidase
MRYYRALKSVMAPVDVITEDREFDRYPFLVAPAYQLVSDDLVTRWKQYAKNGGHLILTARTGQKDMRGHLWEGPWAQPILDLIGARIVRYDVLPANVTGHVQFVVGKSYSWGSWGDILEPADGTEVLARYADQFYSGSAAAVTRKFGKGTVSYVGIDTESGDLERVVLHQIFLAAGAKPASLPPDFAIDWRDGFWVATNFTNKVQSIPAPSNTTLLVGDRAVVPGGVAVWASP